MTDREKLEEMRTDIMSHEENSYERMTKTNVLGKLLIATDEETGKLFPEIIVPMHEHDTYFMKNVLHELGYDPVYKEEWNDFWDQKCYTIIL